MGGQGREAGVQRGALSSASVRAAVSASSRSDSRATRLVPLTRLSTGGSRGVHDAAPSPPFLSYCATFSRHAAR